MEGLGTSPTTVLPIASNQLGAWEGSPLLSVGAATQGDALGPGLGEGGGGWLADIGGRRHPRRGKQLWQGGGEDTGFPPSLSPMGAGLSDSRVLS